MSHEDLDRELKAVDTDAYAAAVARVITGQRMGPESEGALVSVRAEFSNFLTGIEVAKGRARGTSWTPRDRLLIGLGMEIGIAGLQYVIDDARRAQAAADSPPVE